MAYCIRGPGYNSPSPLPTTSATTTAAPTTTNAGPPGPTHAGQPANCDAWHVVESGDSCGSVAAEYGISTDQFFQWNPAVSTDCVNNFWLGQAYCVGVSASTTGMATATGTTTSVPSIPTPTQEGNAVRNCNKYAQAQSGDACGTFADRNDVSLQQLYVWNKLLGSNGEGCAGSLWAEYWYCVGVRQLSRMRPVIQLRRHDQHLHQHRADGVARHRHSHHH